MCLMPNFKTLIFINIQPVEPTPDDPEVPWLASLKVNFRITWYCPNGLGRKPFDIFREIINRKICKVNKFVAARF